MWTCKNCGHRNSDSRIICKMCTTFKCTVKGCLEEFKTYEEFRKHIHEFHGIDEI